ncbi:unnamed protein product [Allacma fusca]|uniref:Uncharacterized protein n=1 Tax=Allacma fusca TaxID=39272 RepID=A0A8J2KJR1_9HEXA|nr:unnamed protein product [Allacma fusca]
MRILLVFGMFLPGFVLPVQYLYFPVPVPAVGRWRMGDGVQFQVRNTQDGSYHFGYDTGTDYDHSYREETRDANGRVEGRYGYIDPNGILRTVEYIADEKGFRTRSADHVLFDNSNIQVIGPIPKPVSRKVYNKEIKSDFSPQF